LAARTFLPFKTAPRLDVDLRHRIGTLQVDVKFSLTQPWTVLFGPSGSGKTTILRAIAGLNRPDSARIAIAAVDSQGRARSWTPVDTHAGRFVAPHQRHFPLAAQSASLFPHMTVRRQIACGMCLMAREIDDEDSGFEEPQERTQRLLDLLRIADLADKLPRALSGGEAQRVNLARAAAASSTLLLLDEPFTGLDPALRSELIRDLRAWAADRNLCVLSVTHDIAEAFQLNAEVIQLADGRLVEQGPAAAVLAAERTRLLTQLNAPNRH
jgi:molybdate transport system ATP-binding protein